MYYEMCLIPPVILLLTVPRRTSFVDLFLLFVFGVCLFYVICVYCLVCFLQPCGHRLEI